jgi:hypothetical protein
MNNQEFPREFYYTQGNTIAEKVQTLLRIIDNQANEIKKLSDALYHLQNTSELVYELMKRCKYNGYGLYSLDVINPARTLSPAIAFDKAESPVQAPKLHIQITEVRDK